MIKLLSEQEFRGVQVLLVYFSFEYFWQSLALSTTQGIQTSASLRASIGEQSNSAHIFTTSMCLTVSTAYSHPLYFSASQFLCL